MDLYAIFKIAHVIRACVLFGTGLGIAFFMWMANRTSEPAIIAATARIVVIADTIFTATAAVAQPVTGAHERESQTDRRDTEPSGGERGDLLGDGQGKPVRVDGQPGMPLVHRYVVRGQVPVGPGQANDREAGRRDDPAYPTPAGLGVQQVRGGGVL